MAADLGNSARLRLALPRMMKSMCLALIAWNVVPGHRLLIANNRDEFHWRRSEPVHRWRDSPVVAGRDARGGGTWLGVTPGGRTGLLTNVRDGLPHGSKGAPTDRSRGLLVKEFLESEMTPDRYAETLRDTATRYQPFNLIVGDATSLRWVSNWPDFQLVSIGPGIHGISNAELDSDWPKVQDSKSDFARLLDATPRGGPLDEGLFRILGHRSKPADARLPDTHVPHWVERAVAPRFVQAGLYGTRASTVIDVADSGRTVISERRYSWFGRSAGGASTVLV